MMTKLMAYSYGRAAMAFCAVLFLTCHNPKAFSQGSGNDRHALLRKLIAVNDESIAGALKRQSVRQNSLYFGAVFDADSVVSPIGTAQLIQTLMCGYVSKDSRYYNSSQI